MGPIPKWAQHAFRRRAEERERLRQALRPAFRLPMLKRNHRASSSEKFLLLRRPAPERGVTTIFEVYIYAGLRDGTFEKAIRRPDTILVHHPEA